MTIDFAALAAEFPRDAVSWRAQTVSKNGDKALALAYIDARDVMRRLDEVCGPAGWQDRYEVHGGKTICYLSIRVDDEWVTKADGSGDSDIEEEKGAISGAFKRAAVKWGIGRYLYDIEAPWAPCESWQKGEKNGKPIWAWSKWTADPWNFVRGHRPAQVQASPQRPAATRPDLSKQPAPFGSPDDRLDAQGYLARAKTDLLGAETPAELDAWWKSEGPRRREFGVVTDTPEYVALVEAFKARKTELAPIGVAA